MAGFLMVLISLTLQVVAFVLCLRLVRLLRMTVRLAAWVLLPSVMGLQALRRGVALVQVFRGQDAPEAIDAAMGLVISAGVLAAVWLIRRPIEAISESEARFRTVADFTFDLEMWLDPQGACLYVSPSCLRILGHPAEAFLADPGLFGRLVHEEDRPLWREHEAGLQGGGGLETSGEIQFRVRRPDGEVRWIGHVWCAVPPQDGRPMGWRISNRDITRGRETEAALKESEEKFRFMTENASDSIWHLDGNYCFDYVSPADERLRGFRPEEVLGTPVWNLFRPEGIELVRRMHETRLAEERKGIATGTMAYELELACKDGSWVWTEINVSAHHDSQHRLVGLHGVTRDITQRKRVEARLQESEQRYRLLVEKANEGILVAQDGRLRFVNPMLVELSGWSAEELVSRPFSGFIHPEDRAKVLAHHVDRMGEVAVEPRYQFRFLRPDGMPRWVEMSGARIEWEGRSATINFLTDITERRRAEADRAGLEVQQRQFQKAESLGRMVGAIAHHFNNKLQSVLASLDLLALTSRGEETDRRIALARQATENAAEVSRMMLTYLGQASGGREPLDLSGLCRSGLPIIQAALPATVGLELDCPFPGPVVQANGNQIGQVLAILVTNAHESMGEGKGSIRLAVRSCPSGDIPSTHRYPVDAAIPATDHALLEVRDTGGGIQEGDIEKLFDPFYSTKFAGRGLGLSVLLGIVRSHGGAVSVESWPGQGSVFRVYLPLSAERVQAPSEPPPPSRAFVADGTLLLVEDDEGLLESAGALVRSLGFECLTAGDGPGALAAFREHRDEIRCVITDLTMPHMDGWETLSALRRIDPGVPVILASGYDRAQVLSAGHPDRPQAFLGKPYGLRELKEALTAVLAAPEGQAPAGGPGTLPD